jgi:hypothetical protein
MPDLSDTSSGWSWVKITIPATPYKIQGSDIPCKSCKVYLYSGTGAFVGPTSALATVLAPALPTSFAGAVTMPIDNINKMWFIGSENDVVMVVYRL